MKVKEVTLSFEYSSFDNLDEVLEVIKTRLTEGNEFYENIYNTKQGKRFIHFKQEYKKLRTFKIVTDNEIIIKANV